MVSCQMPAKCPQLGTNLSRLRPSEKCRNERCQVCKKGGERKGMRMYMREPPFFNHLGGACHSQLREEAPPSIDPPSPSRPDPLPIEEPDASWRTPFWWTCKLTEKITDTTNGCGNPTASPSKHSAVVKPTALGDPLSPEDQTASSQFPGGRQPKHCPTDTGRKPPVTAARTGIKEREETLTLGLDEYLRDQRQCCNVKH